MIDSLPDVALQVLVGLLDVGGWARLLCINSQLQHRVLEVVRNTQHTLSLDCTPRHKHKSLRSLKFAGLYCPLLTALAVYQASAHSFRNLQLLQPCLTAVLQHLTLRGLDLTLPTNQNNSNSNAGHSNSSTRSSCSGCLASELMALLVQSCPQLVMLDLQDCILPSLPVCHSLLAPPLQQQQQQPDAAHQKSGNQLHLKILQLRGAVIKQERCHSNLTDPTTIISGINNTQPAAVQSGRHVQCEGTKQYETSTAADSLQELYLGCNDEPASGWLASSSSLDDAAVIQLLQVAGCQGLQVLDVSRRCSITDELLQYLAQHAPALRMLDISLTSVTPAGVLAVMQRCPCITQLKYACRTSCPSLSLDSIQKLAAAGQQLQELDLSLHDLLDDACMQGLAQCQQLQKLTLSRSHKVTAAGVEWLLQGGHVWQLRLVRCKGVNKARLQQLGAAYSQTSIFQGR